MTPEEIRLKVARKASRLKAGGFRPSGELTESWLGQVFLFKPHENIPVDSKGAPIFPLDQLYLPNLPFVPTCLNGIEAITVFIGNDFPGEFEPMGEKWLIREYSRFNDLVRKDIKISDSFLKAFPVSSELLEDDWPHWDGGGLDMEISDIIFEMEDNGEIEDYYDLANHEYGHKVGGYPSFCQSGIDAGEGFEFAFQISSDSKINLNVVDNGSSQFYKNPQTKEWKIYYDFY